MPVQQIAVSPAFRLQTRANNGKKDSKPKPSPLKKKDGAKETLHPDSPTPKTTERCESRLSLMSAGMEICRICHCESETDAPLMSPCLCSGSMKYVHQACLQKWIKSSENKACELCKYDFVMSTKVKPFKEWEKLHMNPVERRKIVCSVTFHVIAITCVIWSLYVLIDRTTQEVRDGMLEWPFWTKLIVVVIGFSGGIVFMYVQCKMYLQLCRRWRAYNEVIMIENVAPLCKVATVMTLKIDKHEPDLHVDESDVGLGAGVAVEVGVDAGSQANCPTPTSVNTPTPDTSAPSTPTSTLSPREPNSVIITTTSQLETSGSLWTETNSSSNPSTDNETPNTKVVISSSSVEQGTPRTQYPI